MSTQRSAYDSIASSKTTGSPTRAGCLEAGALLVPAARCVVACCLLFAVAPAQQQFAKLGKRGLPRNPGDSPVAVVQGDLDNDGDLDLVFPNHNGQDRLYRNAGAGSFFDDTAGNLPATASQPIDAVLADVDGDGDLDLVTAGFFGQNVLYRNDGTGTFADDTAGNLPSLSGINARSVTAVDVDHDGDSDLVFGMKSVGQARLYLNNGLGTFTDGTAARLPLSAFYANNRLACGDVDGDGDVDLVFSGAPLLFLNNGVGYFSDVSASQLPPGQWSTSVVELGDVDGDGDLDIVSAGGNQQDQLWINDGSGSFSDESQARLPQTNSDVRDCLAIVDVDGDGDLDLATEHYLFQNDGAGHFSDVSGAAMVPAVPGVSAHDLATGDIDGDGDSDLIFSSFTLNNRLFVNDGAGTFYDLTAPRVPYPLGSRDDVAAGDVDGDGDTDLMFLRDRLALNDGTGTFRDVTSTQMPASVGSGGAVDVALGDVDGDGDLDAVVGTRGWSSSAGGAQNRLYVNDGAGTFSDGTASRLPPVIDSSWCVAIADFDGDGSPDFVVGNGYELGYSPPTSNFQDRLYRNNGSGQFTDVTASRLPADNKHTVAVAAGDVDGDGDVDLVFGDQVHSTAPYSTSIVASRNRLYLNNGSGTFTDATSTNMPTRTDKTNDVALGDVDGDGDLDAVFSSEGQNLLYLNIGNGYFQDVTATRMPFDNADGGDVVMGDLDGDGDLDLHFSRQGRIYLNNGTGTFIDVTATRAPTLGHPFSSPFSLGAAVADVDGDGDQDLASEGRLYFNLQRQLDAPLVPRPGYDFVLEVYARYGDPSTAVALPAVSFGLAPAAYPPFGTLHLDPNGAFTLPLIAIDPVTGLGAYTTPLPNNPALVGVQFYTQALITHQSGLARLTNFERVEVKP